MNVIKNSRFSSFLNMTRLVFLFITGAIVIASSGCRHAPVFSDDSKTDVRFTCPDKGYKITKNFEKDFDYRKYFWIHEPEEQVLLMDIIRQHVNPSQREIVVNMSVNGRYDIGEALLRTVTFGLVDIRNYTVKGQIASPNTGSRKRTSQTQKIR